MLDHLQFKRHMSRRDFEDKLTRDLGHLTSSRCLDARGKRMILYYRNDIHVATWQNGAGWAFKAAYKDA